MNTTYLNMNTTYLNLITTYLNMYLILYNSVYKRYTIPSVLSL
jgi:hypothetical protein